MATQLLDAISAGLSMRNADQQYRANELALRTARRAEEQRPLENRLAQIALGQRQPIAPGTPGMKAEPSQQSALMELVALNPELGQQVQAAGFKLAADEQTRAENQARALGGFLESLASLPEDQRPAARDMFLQSPVAQAMVGNNIMEALRANTDFSDAKIMPMLVGAGGSVQGPRAGDYQIMRGADGRAYRIPKAGGPAEPVAGFSAGVPASARPTATARSAAPAAAAPRVALAPQPRPPGKLRPVPVKALDEIMQNRRSIRLLNQAIAMAQGQTIENDPRDPTDNIVGDPEATGMKGYLPDFVLNRVDPAGTETRAMIGDIGSLLIHDRSGAAVTAAETPRLKPFVPLITDDARTVVKKLKLLRQAAINATNQYESAYSRANGFDGIPPADPSDVAPQQRSIPQVNARGWQLMTDAQGNQAYVSPDGKQFEEVR